MKTETQVHDFTSNNIIEEILAFGGEIRQAEDISKVFNLLVKKIASAMETEVCSLYLIDPQSHDLMLRATVGLKEDSVGKVKMRIGEGLVGKTVEFLKPVSFATAEKGKGFKYFPETGEEKYPSFLCVPLIHNRNPIGALVVQRSKPERFSSASIQYLMALTVPVVNLIEKAKLFGTLGQISSRKSDGLSSSLGLGVSSRELLHHGIGASPGIAIAKIKVIHRDIKAPIFTKGEQPIHVEVEKMRILEAFRWVEEEILEVKKKASIKFGMEELSIFEAYKMLLESEPFKEEILKEIENGESALKSVNIVIERYTQELSMAEDDYLKERAYDIQDVGRKITDRLLYGSRVPSQVHYLTEEAILLSDYWSLVDFVEMDLEKVKGILSPSGGATSHISILAQSLGIPAVLGLGSLVERLSDGILTIMDGTSGVVIANPTENIIQAYQKEIQYESLAQKKYESYAKKRVGPIHGKKIIVGANMGLLSQVNQALHNGADEIGLYRTEIPFLIRGHFPTEEEQFQLYKKILIPMKGKPVTMRTLDVGGDKFLPYLHMPRGENPSLGFRAIRFSLEREDLFRIQLRALLRVSVFGSLRLLFPMISRMEEIQKVKEIIQDVKKELKSQKYQIASQIPLGIMIEVPSAVELADALAKEVQFFSIGTNDLIQYTLAVDRNNTKVAKLYSAYHPAVLRMIKRTIDAAHAQDRLVSLCGEMAGQILAVILLVGMGIDSLSVSSPMIPKIKNFISLQKAQEMQALSKKLLKLNSSEEILAELKEYMNEKGLNDFLPHATPQTS